MGCLASCCQHLNVPNVEKRFHIIDITDMSDQSSDNSLKGNISNSKKDVTPLLEGPTLLAFRNLNLSSSSSTDLEINKINDFFKSPEDTDAQLENSKPSGTKDGASDRTFMGAANLPSD